MNIKQFLKNKNNILLFFNTLTSILLIVFCALSFDTLLNCEVFPERFLISEMEPHMIELGEDVVLIKIYTYLSLFGLFLVSNIVLSTITFNIFFGWNTLTQSEFKHKKTKDWILYYVFSAIVYLITLFFTILIIWYYWLVQFKTTYFKFYQSPWILIKNKYSGSKLKKNIFLILTILFPIVFIGTLTASILLSDKNNHTELIPDQNVVSYSKISKNKQNVFYLYFDRMHGLTWNMLLNVDRILNKENSFISLFPEFESYLNTISLSTTTKLSNPSIYAGTLFHPTYKDNGIINYVSGMKNSEMTLDNWYFSALYALSSMLTAQDTKYISYNNLPYYRNGLMGGAEVGNMYELQKDFNNSNLKNVITMTNAKLDDYYLDYKIKLLDNNNLYDATSLNNLTNIINPTITDSGKFFSFFSQQTHEPYAIYKDNKANKSNKLDSFIDSMWYVIQKLKDLFLKLKSIPFVDENNNPIYDKNNNPISVYDKSLIVILSDHGYDTLKIDRYHKLIDYLKKNSVLDQNQVNVIKNFYNNSLNPVITIKDFKYNKNNELINNHDKFIFNDDQIIALSDISVIIENALNRYNNQNLKSFFISDELVNAYYDISGSLSVKKSILKNPLDKAKNSIVNRKVENRYFNFFYTKDWRYSGTSKDFMLWKLKYFIPQYLDNGIFDDRNFVDNV